ncbi:hypothetical protein [Sporolactobacillus laevolacticus]|uniref:hypothetical protein n=1 Tax=Sporolactobacillus laevolacticus TaxID=33018 RepID=UPI000416F1DF|nr:hypothetical protein [Sporolactobacillus laevolacticus]
MKDIKLVELELINFKGIRNLFITANGQDIDAFGENASGKTTIADGYNWLLFGKDSRDRTDFSIKTLLKSGEPVHHRDHSVSGAFTVNGKPLALKRVYHEIWTKKKNSPKETFSGHETKYYINGVPSRKREYDLQVMSLVNGDEKLFKLLSSPTCFNEVMPWKDRRSVLLNICGDVSIDTVVKANDELKDLPDIIGDHNIDDFKKIVSEQKKEINSDLKDIEPRIDENQNAKPNLDNYSSEEDLRGLASALQKKIDEIDDHIAQIRSGGEVTELKNEILKIRGEQQEFRNGYQSDLHKKIDSLRVDYYDRKTVIDKQNRRIQEIDEENSRSKAKIDRLKEKAEDLRHEWAAVNAEIFTFSGETVCPTCKQDLPENKVEEARKHAEQHFNLDKAQRLQGIQSSGKETMAEVQRFESEISAKNLEVEQIKADLVKKTAVLEAMKKEADELNTGTSSVLDDPKYQEMESRIAEINAKINDLRNSIDDAIMAETEEKSKLRKSLFDFTAGLKDFEQSRKIDKRIRELEMEERDLTAKFERAEYILHLINLFTETKSSLLEERINEKFKFARFKLFDRQVNGDLTDVCEMTYDGVPFSDLNNAARINVGLDVIDTLSEFYGIHVPIFVDNRESVTNLAETNAQVISLIVSAKDKELRIVNKSEIAEEVI